MAPEPAPPKVTLTIDGRAVEANKGEMIIAAAERAGVYIPRFCYHPRMKPVGMCRMCLIELKGPRGFRLTPACFVAVADGMEVVTTSPAVRKAQDGRARVPPRQPPARLPGVRQGRRVPAPGPDPRLRARREPLRRGEAPLGEAHRPLRAGAAGPGTLHPVRPLHPLRRRGRGRPADRLRHAGRRDGGGHLPRRALRLLLQRQHRPDLPRRRPHRQPVPLQGAALGPRAGGEQLHQLRRRLPGGHPVERRPDHPATSASTPIP